MTGAGVSFGMKGTSSVGEWAGDVSSFRKEATLLPSPPTELSPSLTPHPERLLKHHGGLRPSGHKKSCFLRSLTNELTWCLMDYYCEKQDAYRVGTVSMMP